MSEMVIQQLLTEAGIGGIGQELVSVDACGAEVAADWENLRAPENYLGYDRTENFASPSGAVLNRRRVYASPARLGLNQWALSGDWTVGTRPRCSTRLTGGLRITFTPAICISSWDPQRQERPYDFKCASMDSHHARSTYERDDDQIPGGIRVLSDEIVEWTPNRSKDHMITTYCT